MVKIVNLTPHTLNILDENGTEYSFPSDGIARAAQSSTVVGTLNGIEVVKTTFGAPEGLPDPEEGVFIVVSLATANAAKAAGRTVDDLLLTSDPVRDADGRIIGCRRFARI